MPRSCARCSGGSRTSGTSSSEWASDSSERNVSGDLKQSLDTLRRFRHRTRHAYDEDYDWQRMTGALEAKARARAQLPAFFTQVEQVVRDIIRALEQAGGSTP